jgi:aliphatic sulfonates family ABC transporter substrate-binding protein
MPVLTLPSANAASLSIRAKALVFEDPNSQALLARIEQVAPSDATILVTGETGTGKEIVARQIHQLSRRSDGAFVAVNCGAFSENLVESELFGHEKGAFTGALQSKAGWFEAARGGTLFLDEVGDLPLSVQVKLLRVLQENEVVRVGSRQSIPINVRLIAATNVDLQDALAAGRFREDLFYRLNVVSVGLPPLRERPGDIPVLAEYFVDMYQRRLGVEKVQVSPNAVARLLAHSWPGNIRELENTMHHAVLVCRDNRVDVEDLRLTAQPVTARPRPPSTPPPPLSRSVGPVASVEQGLKNLEETFLGLFEFGIDQLRERVDEVLMRTAFRYSEQNQLQTARLLGMSRNVVRARLIQHGELAGQLRSSAMPLQQIQKAASLIAARGSRTNESDYAEPGPCDEPATSSPRSARASSSVLRIGYQTFGRLVLVKTLGNLDRNLAERGVAVEWVQFPGGMQLIEAMQGGRIDLGVVGECPPVFAQAAAAPIVYLASEAAPPEAEAIIVPEHSKLGSVGDLLGRTIALNRGANVHYLVIRALEEVGLRHDDVELKYLAPAEAKAAFERGLIDAWAIWDPWLTSIRRTLRARTLRDGTGLTLNTTYYIADRAFAETNPGLVDRVLATVERTTRLPHGELAAAAGLIAQESGMQPQALLPWMTGLSSLSRMNQASVMAQQAIADHLYGLRLVPQAIRVADAQWSRRPRPRFERTADVQGDS